MDAFLGKNSQNRNLDISEIQSSIMDKDTFLDLPIDTSIQNNQLLFNLDTSNINNNNNNNNKTNNVEESSINNTKSFLSLKSNDTLGIDISKLIEENGMINQKKQNIKLSKDLPILQEINFEHDKIRSAITKRFSGLKLVTERWKNSDIPSTLNALEILKDYSVIKDFFDYAIISRKDITQIPFTLDNGLIIVPYVNTLLRSKVDVYWKTACRAGMIFLKIYMEKIEVVKISQKHASPMQVDQILEEKIKKCDQIIKIFSQIYESSYLKKHIKKEDNENNSLAYAFYVNLEFFLKTFQSQKII